MLHYPSEFTSLREGRLDYIDSQIGQKSTMLSRGTSNASYRPRRAKSTSSIRYQATGYGGISTIDPGKAYQDALTAATLAYERTQGHQGIRTNTAKEESEQDRNMSMGDRPALNRHKSIRFVGPNAIPLRRQSITRREAPGRSLSQIPPCYPLPTHALDASPDVPEYSGEVMAEEFNESYVASEPSSYRKLRKAKSMFNPVKDRHQVERHSMRSSGGTGESFQTAGSSLKRSYSFRRGATDRISIGNRQHTTHDAAIQLARDTYLRQLEEQRLRKRPSLLNLDRRRCRQKSFRTTVRTSSTNSYGTAISSPLPSMVSSDPQGLGVRARNLSQSWKGKLKRIFMRSSNENTEVPIQHLTASQPHYGSRLVAGKALERASSPPPEPNAEFLCRVASRVSSSPSEPLDFIRSSRLDSLRSVSGNGEEQRDRSRVTSWTNSTGANTINIPSFMERQHLSIITEDGGIHQLPPANQPTEDPRNGYAKFRQPLKQGNTGQLETERIFSALQRQIDENNRKAAVEERQVNVDSSSSQRGDDPVSSIAVARQITRPSIWHSKSIPNASSETHTIDPPSGITGGLTVDGGDPSDQHVFEASSDALEKPHVDSNSDLTPQQIALFNELNIPIPRQPLREIKSTFFPPSTRIERIRASPYKRAMNASRKVEEDFDRFAAKEDQINTSSVARTESVYSNSSGGQDLQRVDSLPLLARSEGSLEGRIALLARHPTVKHESSAQYVFPHGYSLAEESGEKKRINTFSSSETDKNPNSIDESFIKDRRHKRESAQLDADSAGIGFLRKSNDAIVQPLGLIQEKMHKQTQPVVGRSLFSDKTVPTEAGAANLKENTPVRTSSIPSSAHADTNFENLSSDIWKSPHSAVYKENQYSSLTPKSDPGEDAVSKSQSCSPNRARRLCRLRSGNARELK